MISPTHQTHQSVRYSSGATETRSSEIAIKFEVVLSVNSAAWLSFRCSPENLEALASGYLYIESFIQSAQEIATIDFCEQRDHVDVWLNHGVTRPDTWSRASGCQGGVTEMVYKAARMQVPLAVSLYSVSQMAIQRAESLGMTLIGHARRSQIDIYSHSERIIIPTSSN